MVSQVLNQQCSQTMAFVVAGFAKVYVGEIIEKGKKKKVYHCVNHESLNKGVISERCHVRME